MSLYEIMILGAASRQQVEKLSCTIEKAIEDFGLSIGSDVTMRDSEDWNQWDPKASTAAAYFADEAHLDEDVASWLLDRSIPLIPVIKEGGTFEILPDKLKIPNGLMLSSADPEMNALASALLESVGLLRQQRRVFVSYRRTESRGVAVQLHDILTGRGFDVFLDTHDIRPGEPFQDVLWHRMTDSDVVIVLDTKTYFERKWTREEFGKAMAKEIHIFRLVWPGHQPTEHLDTGEMVKLSSGDFTQRGELKEQVVDKIAVDIERIRSRSIAARFRTLSGKLSAEIARMGAQIEGISAHHAVAIRLSRGRRVWAYPVVGIPTANLLNEIAERASGFGDGTPVMVYDHAGIRDPWLKHLDWLDANIGAVDTIKVFDAASRLVELDT